MKIVITGAAGLLGWHLRCRLSVLEAGKYQVVALDREGFNDDLHIKAALVGAEAIVHCAGINRASDDELERGNEDLAQRLADVLSELEIKPHVLYANSIHRDKENSYGRGKSRANTILSEWASSVGAAYSELVLPHVFGENGRPFYNSVVFTFCHQIIEGEQLAVDPNGQLELLHAQDIACQIVDLIQRGHEGECRLRGRVIPVAEVVGRLSAMYDSYVNDIIPDLRDRFDLQLFNTLRSFLYPGYYPKSLKLHADSRGALFEAVKNRNGGQAFLSTTKPGITRGNHFHFSKVERFLVIRGQAVIRLRRLFDDEVVEFHVAGDSPVYIDMPPLHTHSITNTGDDELMTLFWSHEIFDPEAPDTYFLPVLAESE